MVRPGASAVSARAVSATANDIVNTAARLQAAAQEHVALGGQALGAAHHRQVPVAAGQVADAVQGRGTLAYSPRESIKNMRVLDALAQAARSSARVSGPKVENTRSPPPFSTRRNSPKTRSRSGAH